MAVAKDFRRWINLLEGEVIQFPGNQRPVSTLAAVRGAEVRAYEPRIDLDDLDGFTRGYVQAALWSSLDADGESLDANYNIGNIAYPTLKRMIDDCQNFQRQWANLLAKSSLSPEQAGRDFWLTRNRHGAGYWDRGLGKAGEALSDAARAYGEFDLVVGDDGKIYD